MSFHENERYENEFAEHFKFTKRYALTRRKRYTPPDTTIDIHDAKDVLSYVTDKFPREHFEGGSTKAHLELFTRLIKPYAKRDDEVLIAEIGFNAGVSAEFFLKSCPTSKMISFDIIHHPYVMAGKAYIDEKYPDRHTMIAGDSAKSVPNFASIYGGAKMDVIFVDGNHLYEYAKKDVINMKELADENTLVLLDNVSPMRGCAVEVYLAWKHLLQIGFIKHVGFEELNTYDGVIEDNPKVKIFTDGEAWFKYNFDFSGDAEELIGKIEDSSESISESVGGPAEDLPDFTFIERVIPGWELASKLKNLTDAGGRRFGRRSSRRRDPETEATITKITRRLDYLYEKTVKTGIYYVDDYYKKYV